MPGLLLHEILKIRLGFSLYYPVSLFNKAGFKLNIITANIFNVATGYII